MAFTPYATVADNGVMCLSASKTWNVTGLKCGVLICSTAEQFARLSQQTVPFREMAGVLGVTANIVAFTDPAAEVWRTECLSYLDGNRRLLAELLDRHLPGTRYWLPEATFLAWVDCAPLGLPQAPATVFLEQGKVRLYDGSPFGQEGTRWVRMNFATTRHILTQIVERMGQTVA